MNDDSPLIEAIALWEKLTGVAPPDAKGYWGSGAGINTWAIRDTYAALKEALDLDPTEITATLLFKRFINEYLRQATASMAELLKDPAACMAQLATAKQLLAIVDRPEIVQVREDFVARLTMALRRDGAAERADIQKTLADEEWVASLRRDALRSVKTLRLDQFLTGAPEAADFKPVYQAKVHQWWNVNSLLEAATTMPSGVSLNLIRDKDDFQSYFCFCIRNGANLYVLSDAPLYAHPLQAQMTRRPDRTLGLRTGKAWFPYDLLGVKYDEEAKRLYIEKSDEKGLAVYQQEWKVLKPIAELDAPETIWATMMLDLIVDRFWRKGEQASQLSYTGEMIKIADRLANKAFDANLPVAAGAPLLQAAPLTVAEMLTDNADEAQIGKKGAGRNRWLEDRYKDRINPAVLNIVDQPGTAFFLPDQRVELHGKVLNGRSAEGRKGAGLGELVVDAGLRRMRSHEVAALGHFEAIAARKHSLVSLDATRMGTAEQLEADRRYLARHNMASQINQLARAEYEARRDEVVKWFVKACKKNLPAILTWCGNSEIYLDFGLMDSWSSSGSAVGKRWGFDREGGETHNFGTFNTFVDIAEERRTRDYNFSVMGSHNIGGYDKVKSYLCAETGAKASYKMYFNPSNALELAVLAGVEIKDLPDVLQHWQQGRDYVGNAILDRIDPMEWHAQDPWRREKFSILVPLSIRALRRARDNAALPPLPYVASAQEFEAARAGHDPKRAPWIRQEFG